MVCCLPQSEAWVFETAGVAWWAAEQVSKGKTRNISNGTYTLLPKK